MRHVRDIALTLAAIAVVCASLAVIESLSQARSLLDLKVLLEAFK